MRGGTGQPQRIAVVGASSEIAQAAVRAIVARGGVEDVVLVAREPTALAAFAAELRAAGVSSSALAWTAADPSEDVVDGLWAEGDVDLVLVAVGQLPDAAAVEEEPGLVRGLVETNLAGPAELGLRAALMMREQGHGTLVVLSSVAAERPRADSYPYAATKAGLDAFFTGLGDRLIEDGVDVVVVRPGFVHTRMTEGLAPAPLATTPDKVGADIARAVAAGGPRTVWSPAPVRVLMSVLRHLPRPLFRRLAASR